MGVKLINVRPSAGVGGLAALYADTFKEEGAPSQEACIYRIAENIMGIPKKGGEVERIGNADTFANNSITAVRDWKNGQLYLMLAEEAAALDRDSESGTASTQEIIEQFAAIAAESPQSE
ncbi:MAG: hypothetical protein PUC46_02965 [Lachnospiraceae bacterium]|nr:hypothetical protein [Lachnospiraceae bacterium]